MRTPKIRPLHGTLEKQGLWTLHAREQHTHASRLKVLQLHLDLRLKVIPNISALSREEGEGKERGKKVVGRGKGGREKTQEPYNQEDWVLFKALHIPN